MLGHPIVAISEAGEHDDAERAADAGGQQQPADALDKQHEPGQVGTGAEEVKEDEGEADERPDEAQRVEELRDDHEGGQQEAADLVVAGGEGVVDPPTAHEEAPLEVVLHVGQRPEAVHPQAQSVQLGAGYPLIADQPTGRREGDHDAHEADDEHSHAAITGQAALLHVGQVLWLYTLSHSGRGDCYKGGWIDFDTQKGEREMFGHSVGRLIL